MIGSRADWERRNDHAGEDLLSDEVKEIKIQDGGKGGEIRTFLARLGIKRKDTIVCYNPKGRKT